MKRLIRSLASRADGFLCRRPLTMVGSVIVLSIAAEFVLMWQIRSAFGKPPTPPSRPAATRPADDLAIRLEKIERRLDELGTIFVHFNP